MTIDHPLKDLHQRTTRRQILSGATALGLSASLTPLTVSAQPQRDVLRVVTTTMMLAEPLRQFFPEHVTVHAIMGNTVDPHLYVPIRTDIRELVRADVIVHNGLHLEGQMTDIFERFANIKTTINACQPFRDRAIVHGGNLADPHLWMDPLLWKDVLMSVRERILLAHPTLASSALDPQPYNNRLDRLATFAQEALASVPRARRYLITNHDAFAYFGRRFDVQTIGIRGLSTVSEASLRRINEVVDLIVRRGITTVFYESTTSDRLINAVSEEVRRRDGRSLTVGPPLFSDALGRAGSREGTYVGMMEHNIRSIILGLGGALPQTLREQL